MKDPFIRSLYSGYQKCMGSFRPVPTFRLHRSFDVYLHLLICTNSAYIYMSYDDLSLSSE